jgi:non-specific serine/threonine protein kinase
MLGMCARASGELEVARHQLEEALVLLRAGDDVDGLAFVLNQLGQLARARGGYATAHRFLEQSLALFREVGAKPHVPLTLSCLGNVARLEHDVAHAEAALGQAMQLAYGIGARFYLSASLLFAGMLAIERRQDARGLRLIGAATQCPELRTSLDADEIKDWDACLADARAHVGRPDFERFQSEGHGMDIEDVLAYAGASADLPTDSGTRTLSHRERRVVALIAAGRSNREIGEELSISQRTVEAHVTHVLNKLGARTRVQIAVWASSHDLVAETGV